MSTDTAPPHGATLVDWRTRAQRAYEQELADREAEKQRQAAQVRAMAESNARAMFTEALTACGLPEFAAAPLTAYEGTSGQSIYDYRITLDGYTFGVAYGASGAAALELRQRCARCGTERIHVGAQTLTQLGAVLAEAAGPPWHACPVASDLNDLDLPF